MAPATDRNGHGGGGRRRRVLLLPLPYHGHINPMLRLAGALHARGLAVTIVHTEIRAPDRRSLPAGCELVTVPDGLPPELAASNDIPSFVLALNRNCAAPFRDLLASALRQEEEEEDGGSVACVVADVDWFAPLAAARELGVPALNTWRNSPSPVVAQVADRMLTKFEGYWDLTRPVMAFASILDPRYKMKSVEYFCRLIYAADQFRAKTTIDDIRQSFTNLCSEYEQSGNSFKNPSALFYSGTSNSCMSSVYSNGDDFKTFSRITLSDARRGLDQYIQETSSGQSFKSDLDMYLEEPVYRQKEGHLDNFDILGWWKSFAAKYPVLSQMARDILAIPVSIIPLDSDARTLNEYLSTMDPSTVQGLVCAQDWLREDTEVASSDGHADDKAARGDELIVLPK